ncbi:M20/M25/M40 family metallo-hydrolase [Geothrix sp. PMB-07]|uniref:M20/M25/M40 family metallo-hydrolase n=1 Tax=Geothrix sp. PMB-07 TaxID=3068640 RepID=UPI002742012B|nr:M20/M25/M40 family metallo-hydrolase [Geothrix sp. PMB-07]WLT30365.1 M20/M25/M40 family metallo-hydrolase [Geothrix sp. PMB-07]
MRSWMPLLFAATLVAPVQALAQAPASKADQAAEQRLRKDVTFLAAPELKGRGNGYPELDVVAKRIQDELKALGLQPQIQRFPFIARVARERQAAAVTLAGSAHSLVWGKDIEALGLSGDADFKGKPLAFAGYGVQIPGGYDDFAGLDLKDRVVVIARTVPDLDAFAHLPRGERGLLARLKKLETAKAAGVIVLEDALRPLQREEGPVKVDLPVVGMTVEGLGGACGDVAARLKAIKETGRPGTTDAPAATFSLELKLRRDEAQIPNVVTVIPGQDAKLSKEYIVLGAHMDHLGLGERHSMGGAEARGQIHPGADDNASGTALVVELARELKDAKPRRSILLLNFAGEEEGLLGSQYWVQHPTHPLEAVKFMLNFDMVGRLDPKAPKLMMGGLGAPKSAVEAAQKFVPKDFAVSADVGASVGGSDHMSFSQAKIPTFFFFTGIHGEYHRPTDTADRINYPGMVKLAAFGKAVTLDLANADTLPAFDPETAKLPSRGDGGPMRIAFGTIPDYADNPKGFRINGVSKDGTAETIGLQAGDILIQFGDKVLKNVYDFMGALGAYKPGDKVLIQWLRGDQLMKAEATLKGRS